MNQVFAELNFSYSSYFSRIVYNSNCQRCAKPISSVTTLSCEYDLYEPNTQDLQLII